MRIALAAAAVLACAGCATVSYVTQEYGSALKDGQVMVRGTDAFDVWVHKTKPKLMVVVSLSRAAGMGMAQGLTLGGVQAGAPEPDFEAAAVQWFADQGKPHCKVGRGRRIDAIYYEFDYDCAPPAAAPPAPRRR